MVDDHKANLPEWKFDPNNAVKSLNEGYDLGAITREEARSIYQQSTPRTAAVLGMIGTLKRRATLARQSLNETGQSLKRTMAKAVGIQI